MVSGLNGMAIKGCFSSSVLSSTQELVIILVKFLQHLLGAANVVHISKYGSSMAKESDQKGHFYVLQLNSHRITVTYATASVFLAYIMYLGYLCIRQSSRSWRWTYHGCFLSFACQKYASTLSEWQRFFGHKKLLNLIATYMLSDGVSLEITFQMQ